MADERARSRAGTALLVLTLALVAAGAAWIVNDRVAAERVNGANGALNATFAWVHALEGGADYDAAAARAHEDALRAAAAAGDDPGPLPGLTRGAIVEAMRRRRAKALGQAALLALLRGDVAQAGADVAACRAAGGEEEARAALALVDDLLAREGLAALEPAAVRAATLERLRPAPGD